MNPLTKRSSNLLGNPDGAAAALSDSLDGAVSKLSESQKRTLACSLELPAHTTRHPWNHPAKRALLIVAAAVIYHSRLDNPLTAQHRSKADNPITAFYDAWQDLLASDRKPIFELACNVLLACPPDIISDTAEAALDVVKNNASLRHDLLGRIFHTVLDTARYDGSFYTTTAAATLLASLAITDDMCDWNDPDAISNLRITDPACGTGTLLMAAAERIHELAKHDVSSILIENVLSGYDVNLTATHMAATTLGLLSPSTQFRNMKIFRAFLGVDSAGDAKLGSLEFLDQKPMLLTAHTGSIEPADLVIMNPPFTRSDLRHDQFSKDVESKLKAREKELFANAPVHLSSNGNAFLVLADYIRKIDKGAIAAILPLVTATNTSALEIRQFLGRNYHVELIVTSHDPERIYFSENTTIGEMLLICRRWNPVHGKKPKTKVVNLAVNPDTSEKASKVAALIKSNDLTVQYVDAERIEAGDWGAVQFISPNLCNQFIALKQNELFTGLNLKDIANIGPAGSGVRTTFNRSQMPTPDGMVALWHHKTDITQSMAARVDTHIAPKSGKESSAKRLWEQRGTLMLPTRARLNTVRMLSVRVNTPAVGSAWVPCRLRKPEMEIELLEKSLCVYFNSSIGILAMLGDRSSKTLSYPQFSMADLKNLYIPDFDTLGCDAVNTLVSAYDAYANTILLPLPQMDTDPIRAELDTAVCAALRIDENMVATIRSEIAAEPSVTSKRYSL